MTAAEKLRQEGRQEGLQSMRRVLLKQLRLRFGDLPDPVVARIEQASLPELEQWAERVLTADSMEDVLDQTT